MHSRGHVGAALFCYGFAGAALTRVNEPDLAIVGAIVAVVLATLPDADEYLPIAHRGLTHTVWFVTGVATLSALAGGILGYAVGRQLGVAVTVGTAAAIALSSHLLADSITPMGIRPFYPLSTWHHSFGVTPAANPRANTAMLGFGVAFALFCQLIAFAIS